MLDLIEMNINNKIQLGIDCLSKNKLNEAEKIFKSLLQEKSMNAVARILPWRAQSIGLLHKFECASL